MKQVYDEMQTKRAAQDKKLADALGVSTSELKAAQEKLRKDKLDAEVKANRLTQAQADAIVACEAAPLTCDRSNLPAGGPGGRHGGKHGAKGARGTFAADLAKALGIDQAKVEQALKDTRPERPTQGGMPGRGGHDGPHGPGGHGGPGGPPGGGFGGGFGG
jgi:DNA-binding Xre family transcriptional regulator